MQEVQCRTERIQRSHIHIAREPWSQFSSSTIQVTPAEALFCASPARVRG
ncbi:MAG: hypothetical protein AAF685_04085 [Cyanobacteria bacterium P01_C01_bin.89]